MNETLKKSKLIFTFCKFSFFFSSRAIFIKFMPYSTPMACTEGEKEKDIENIGFFAYFFFE